MTDGPRLPKGTVTFLFTDIEGSTRLARILGSDYDTLLDVHRQLIRDAFENRHGVEVGCPGDGFVIAFENATDAVEAAADAQRQLTHFVWPEGAPLKVRMGLHCGPVRVTTTGGTYVGLALHEAERVMSAAHGGQVLVSEPTRALASPSADIGFADLGDHELRDLEGARRLYALRAPGLGVEFPPPRGAVQPGNLPAPVRLIGRDEAVASIVRLLRPGRVVTLVGPGGVGKTSLAMAVAREGNARGGSWLVDLSLLERDAPTADVVMAVGNALSIETHGDAETLVAAMRTRDALVLMDNCEHVIAAASTVVTAIAERCEHVLLLATSREALALRSEALFVVEPLAIDHAEALFHERAADLAVDVEGDSDGVRRICRSLDGLPLAVELAARRARALSPSAIADRLDDRFRLLTAGTRASGRHATLDATVRWSHDLLLQSEQILFRRLSVFVGGCTLRAAEQVCGIEPLSSRDVVDILTNLVERSMVQLRPDDRYTMLETLRTFGSSELERAGEVEQIRHAQLRWAAEASDTVHDLLFGSGPGLTEMAVLRELAAEIGNIRAAVGWALSGHGDADDGLRAASVVGMIGQEIGANITEAQHWIDELLPMGQDPMVRAEAMLAAANAALAGSGAVGPYVSGALAIASDHEPNGEVMLMARALEAISWIENPDKRERARRVLDELGGALGKRGMPTMQAMTLSYAATAAIEDGETEQALVLAEEGVSVARRAGSQLALARNLEHVARALARLGDFDAARVTADEALAVAVAGSFVGEEGVIRARLSRLAARRGDWAECVAQLDLSIACLEQGGLWGGAVRARAGAAATALILGDRDVAREHVHAAVRVASLSGNPDLAALYVAAPIRTARANGDDALAAEFEAIVASRR